MYSFILYYNAYGPVRLVHVRWLINSPGLLGLSVKSLALAKQWVIRGSNINEALILILIAVVKLKKSQPNIIQRLLLLHASSLFMHAVQTRSHA